MTTNTSQHILPTSANLLGFCLFVITSIHVTNRATSSLIDEFASIVALLLTFSCLLSFVSIRTKHPNASKRLESIADYIFIVSLVGIVILIFLLVLGIIK